MTKIRTRPKSGPVNRSIVLAAGFAALAWTSTPSRDSGAVQIFINGLGWIGAAAFTARGGRLLIKDYRLRRNLAISQMVSTDHGSARQSTKKERAARGMNDPQSGELLGLDDDSEPVWRPLGSPFSLIEAAPGTGKTVCMVMGSIMHRARLGYSLIIPDVKCELAVQLAPDLRKAGFEVWCINPAKRHIKIIGGIEINAYQAVIDALYGDPDARKDAVKVTADYAALHYPLSGEEKNPYFAHGSRRAILLSILSQAVIDPANCTPTAVYALLTDPAAFLERCRYIRDHLETLIKDDRVLRVLRLEARNMLHRAAKNEENFASFLEGASQRLIAFNPSGHLGDYGAGAIHNLTALRERQVIVFIVTPLSHMREFADFTSLLNHNLIAACKAKPDGRPVHLVGEEALNYQFQDLAADLETMRGLRLTADFYIQSFAGLERRMGRAVAAAIESYADVRIYAGINSLARSKHVSDMLSDATIRKQEVSHKEAADELGLSSREMARPLMKPDEVLAMDREHAWLFVRGMKPLRIRLITYAQVAPWSGWVGESPITGTRLHARPLVHVPYPNNGDRDAAKA